MPKYIFKGIPTSLSLSGIPPSHYHSTLNNFEDVYKHDKFVASLQKVATELLTMEIAKHPRYVILLGGPGCGKTHFMVGLYKAMIQNIGYIQGDGALYVSATALSQELISLFSQNIPLRPGLQRYEASRWIFLDDFTSSERVFKENSLEFNILRDLIIDRYDKNYTLVTSANIASVDFLGEMDRMYGDYVVSRLSDSRIIQFPTGKDQRRVR